MKIIALCIAFLFLFACNDKSSEAAPAVNSDSTGIIDKSIAASFDDKEFTAIKLPLVIDTNFILEVDTNNKIPYQQIRQLGTGVLKTDISSGLLYDINSFCEIDSIKQEGAYEAYLEKLDIGMTKIAISFKIGVADFANGSKLFLWGVHNSSFEACPFFAGTTIIATYMSSQKNNTHFVVGEISGGGDPPSMGNDEVTAQIAADGSVEIHRVSLNDDLDIPGVEKTTENLKLKLLPDKIEILRSQKKVTNTEKPSE